METAALLSVIGLLIALVSIGIPLLVRWLNKFCETINSQVCQMRDNDIHSLELQIEAASQQRERLRETVIVMETKLDMILDRQGYDVHKVNRAIKEHMEELKQNGTPSVGCIHPNELFKEGG